MMRHVWITTTIAAAVLSVAVAGAQDRKVDLPSSAITVTGCLQQLAASPPIEQTPLGAPVRPQAQDNAGAAKSAGFVLTEATPAVPSNAPTPPAPTEPGVAGTTGTAPLTYALDGVDLELAPHEGHRVEITGTLAPPASPTTGQSSTDKDPAQRGTRRLHVTSIKMIAPDCTTKS
jgi:hypothetical protein